MGEGVQHRSVALYLRRVRFDDAAFDLERADAAIAGMLADRIT
jgi:hypothetical protein